MTEDKTDHDDAQELGDDLKEKLIDRKRAALTRTDREYLLGRKNYESDQADRNARYRIREHLRHSFIDLGIVALDDDGLLEDTALKQAEIASDNDDTPVHMPTETMPILTCRLLHTRAREQGKSFESVLEPLIERGIETAMYFGEQDTVITNVDVDISIETKDIDDYNMLMEIIFGEPSYSTLASYVGAEDEAHEKLRTKLRELDQTIDVAEGDSIGPDSVLLNPEQVSERDESD